MDFAAELDKETRQLDIEIDAHRRERYLGWAAATGHDYARYDDEESLNFRMVDSRYEDEEYLDDEISFRGDEAAGMVNRKVAFFGIKGNAGFAVRDHAERVEWIDAFRRGIFYDPLTALVMR